MTPTYFGDPSCGMGNVCPRRQKPDGTCGDDSQADTVPCPQCPPRACSKCHRPYGLSAQEVTLRGFVWRLAMEGVKPGEPIEPGSQIVHHVLRPWVEEAEALVIWRRDGG